VTFKLRPLPAETRTIVAFGALEKLLNVGRQIAQSGLAMAVELVSARLFEGLALGAKAEEAGLLIRFAGPSRFVITYTAQTLKTLREVSRCETSGDEVKVWRKLAAATYEPSHNLSWRARVRPTNLAELIKQFTEVENGDAPLAELGWHAGLGDGRVTAMARMPTYHREAVRALMSLRQKTEDLGGHLVVNDASVEIKNELNSWGSFGSATELMNRIKQQLDPANILSPGRFDA
jgi:glycolate oxidase FAD binding subunit